MKKSMMILSLAMLAACDEPAIEPTTNDVYVGRRLFDSGAFTQSVSSGLEYNSIYRGPDGAEIGLFNDECFVEFEPRRTTNEQAVVCVVPETGLPFRIDTASVQYAEGVYILLAYGTYEGRRMTYSILATPDAPAGE